MSESKVAVPNCTWHVTSVPSSSHKCDANNKNQREGVQIILLATRYSGKNKSEVFVAWKSSNKQNVCWN